MLFCFKRAVISALLPLLVATSTFGLVARQFYSIPSGFYRIWSISVPGFPIGYIPGPFVGVENDTASDPTGYTFAVLGFPQGYVLHLASGNVVPSQGAVSVVDSYPGGYWDIVPLDNGLYAIETTDRAYGWILPHDAPPGTPVGLTTPLNPRIPAEFFVFDEVAG